MVESRTRERALAELMRLLPQLRMEIQDEKVRAALSNDLVKEIFEITWAHQFDDDRTVQARMLRDIVREAIEGIRKDK